MSDNEDDENYCFFGKPLEPYDEDTFPKRKPIAMEDQMATDAQGRRRFHGAFTGGFSAGFFNTVGSLEGWTPSEFKSTRLEKAQSKTQKPEDFMDDEDMGQFGIAPETIKATKEFSTSKKRQRQVFSDGPIPGEPVLHSLLTSGNETIGYLLLKNIGLKGRNLQTNPDSQQRVYSCEMPKQYEISNQEPEDDIRQYEIPQIYSEFLKNPKTNTFGLGYSGLDKSHVNLFQSSKLVIKETNKKKISISGQAFGVGAFEDDDEDIYVKDDMSRYDFELTNEKQTKKESYSKKDEIIFDDFIPSKNILPIKEIFPPPTIPSSFTGKHNVKKSRFEPIAQPELPSREKMNAEVRAGCLGEEISVATPTKTLEKTPAIEPLKKNVLLSTESLMFDRFVSASHPEDISNILEEVKRVETDHGTLEMRDAARMKMFGPLTRINSDWQPCSLLCKRFNVPEPNSEGMDVKSKKRTKNLIFQYEQEVDFTIESLKPGLTTFHDNPKEEVTVNDPVSDVKVVEEEKLPTEDVVKDITEKIDVEKNADLFKAIFLSDDDDEDDDVEEKIEDKQEELKSNVLSDNLLPKIKPLKEGILSMDFSIFKQTNAEENRNLPAITIDPLSYGPKLPEKPTCSLKTTTYNLTNNDEDEWVEKSSQDKKKKHKSKKKKHKHSKNK